MLPNRLLISILSALTFCLALANPVLAGKSEPTGTIELEGQDVTSAVEPHLSYGDEARFRTTFNGSLTSNSRVYITVVCTQDSTVVYQWSGPTDFAYPLVDQAGQGLEWDGGDADCTGALVYREQHGKKVQILFLDYTQFLVFGSAS